MNDKNTMTKKRYLMETVLWSILGMMWYHNRHFRCLNDLSYTASKVILWCMLILCVVFGLVVTWKNRRNNLSLFVNIAAPLEIYTLLAYYRYLHTFAWLITAVTLAISVDYTHEILKRPIKNKAKEQLIILRRIRYSALGARTFVIGGFSLLMVYLTAAAVFHTFCFAPSVPATDGNSTDTSTLMENNMQVLERLNNDVWPTLSEQEQLNTLQTVANIEASYLGLPHELNVRLGTLEGTTMADYNDENHMITINFYHFEYDYAESVLNSVCHEAYHAYQYNLCYAYDSVTEPYKGLRVFRKVPDYQYEFANYINGSDDFDKYYSQQCEADARAYAKTTVEYYYRKIYRDWEEESVSASDYNSLPESVKVEKWRS